MCIKLEHRQQERRTRNNFGPALLALIEMEGNKRQDTPITCRKLLSMTPSVLDRATVNPVFVWVWDPHSNA